MAMGETRRHRIARRPEVERLEAWELLSTTTALIGPPVHPPGSASTIPIPIIVGLNGTARGSFATQRGIPDTGTTYAFRTAGTFAGYGFATVTGTIHSTGFIARGRATGTLLVDFGKGNTLTVAVTGPLQNGFSPLPTQFSFAVTKGTGRFHNATGGPVGKGTMALTLADAPTAVGLNSRGGATMVFRSGLVAVA